MKVIIYSFLLIVIFSCDPGIEQDVLPIDDLFSVSMVISPEDTTLVAYLYKAEKVGSSSYIDSLIYKYAKIYVSDGLKADTLYYQINNKRYEGNVSNISIKSLASYYLTVQIDKSIILTSSCTVPIQPEMPTVTGYRNDNDYIFQVEWNNQPGIEFFTLSGIVEGYYKDISGSLLYDSLYYQPTVNWLNNPIFPAKQLTYNTFKGIIPNAFKVNNPKLFLKLRSVDNNLYYYISDYKKYENWMRNNEGNFLPNFHRLNPIYSNINNGVGIFAGTNEVDFEINIIE